MKFSRMLTKVSLYMILETDAFTCDMIECDVMGGHELGGWPKSGSSYRGWVLSWVTKGS